jgi:endonuclease/exonuclease/phosphatase family metal-dependent hydrolase
MKLISLNTWGGRAGHELLLDFIRKHHDVDVVCLQEVWNANGENEADVLTSMGLISLENVMLDLWTHVTAILPEHRGVFFPYVGEHYGQAFFVRKDVVLAKEGALFTHREPGYIPSVAHGTASTLQYATLETPRGPRTFLNFHGLWNGKGKSDTEDRLRQSDNILTFLKTLDHPFVLIGDFNLLPETESLKKFEQFGLRNLIAEYGFTSTRTSLYKKELRYADYAFVSDGIEVKDFQVLPDEVSDHNPLFIEFE